MGRLLREKNLSALRLASSSGKPGEETVGGPLRDKGLARSTSDLGASQEADVKAEMFPILPFAAYSISRLINCWVRLNPYHTLVPRPAKEARESERFECRRLGNEINRRYFEFRSPSAAKLQSVDNRDVGKLRA